MGSSGGGPGSPLAGGFAERLLEVIDSGRRTATYKLGLWSALVRAGATFTGGKLAERPDEPQQAEPAAEAA